MYVGKPSMKKKVSKFSNFSTVDPSQASSHWLRPDLDAPGSCLCLDNLIIIVLIQLLQYLQYICYKSIFVLSGIQWTSVCHWQPSSMFRVGHGSDGDQSENTNWDAVWQCSICKYSLIIFLRTSLNIFYCPLLNVFC